MLNNYINKDFDSFKREQYNKKNNEKFKNYGEKNKKLNEFDILLGYLWNYKIKFSEIDFTEQPDFIVKNGNEKVGIEIVEFKPDGKIKGKINLKKTLLKDVEKKFKEEYKNKGVYISCGLKDIKIKKPERKNHILKIYNELKEYYEKYYEDKNINYYILTHNDIESSYFDEIVFQKNKDICIDYNPGVFYINILPKKELNNIIEGKNKKMENYSKNVNKNILILFINSSDPSSYDEEDLQIDGIIDSQFNNIYLYLFFKNKIIKLKST